MYSNFPSTRSKQYQSISQREELSGELAYSDSDQELAEEDREVSVERLLKRAAEERLFANLEDELYHARDSVIQPLGGRNKRDFEIVRRIYLHSNYSSVEEAAKRKSAAELLKEKIDSFLNGPQPVKYFKREKDQFGNVQILPSIDITQTHNRFKLLANTLLKKREMHQELFGSHLERQHDILDQRKLQLKKNMRCSTEAEVVIKEQDQTFNDRVSNAKLTKNARKSSPKPQAFNLQKISAIDQRRKSEKGSPIKKNLPMVAIVARKQSLQQMEEDGEHSAALSPKRSNKNSPTRFLNQSLLIDSTPISINTKKRARYPLLEGLIEVKQSRNASNLKHRSHLSTSLITPQNEYSSVEAGATLAEGLPTSQANTAQIVAHQSSTSHTGQSTMPTQSSHATLVAASLGQTKILQRRNAAGYTRPVPEQQHLPALPSARNRSVSIQNRRYGIAGQLFHVHLDRNDAILKRYFMGIAGANAGDQTSAVVSNTNSSSGEDLNMQTEKSLITRQKFTRFLSFRYGAATAQRIVQYLEPAFDLDYAGYRRFVESFNQWQHQDILFFCYYLLDIGKADGLLSQSDIFTWLFTSRLKLLEEDMLRLLQVLEQATQSFDVALLDTHFSASVVRPVLPEFYIDEEAKTYKSYIRKSRGLELPRESSVRKDSLYVVSMQHLEHDSATREKRLKMEQIAQQEIERLFKKPQREREFEQRRDELAEHVRQLFQSSKRFTINFEHYQEVFRQEKPLFFYDFIAYLSLFQFRHIEYPYSKQDLLNSLREQSLKNQSKPKNIHLLEELFPYSHHEKGQQVQELVNIVQRYKHSGKNVLQQHLKKEQDRILQEAIKKIRLNAERNKGVNQRTAVRAESLSVPQSSNYQQKNMGVD